MSETAYPSRFGVFYDFRNPQPWQQPWNERYNALLEQIDWVERTPAFAGISLSEHHFVDDGYSPSVLALATAIGARTQRVEITTNIVQLPLHHPLRVAEDALTADAVSNGRFRLGVAVGYRELEFAAFGAKRSERASRMDEALEILREAFTGRSFSHEGRHWSFPELRVTPGPIRPGGPPILLGGTAPAALHRAARAGDGFLASVDAEVVGYRDARARLGLDPGATPAVRTFWMIVDPDPERALRDLGPFMLHQVNRYIDFGFLDVEPYTDPVRLVQDGFYSFVDADGALDILRTAGAAGVTEAHFFAVLPGEPVESGSRRLQYLANEVLARIPG